MTKSQHMRSTMMIKGLKVGERAKSLGMRTNLTRGTRGGRVRREKSGQGIYVERASHVGCIWRGHATWPRAVRREVMAKGDVGMSTNQRNATPVAKSSIAASGASSVAAHWVHSCPKYIGSSVAGAPRSDSTQAT